jgi:hypothetical protein
MSSIADLHHGRRACRHVLSSRRLHPNHVAATQLAVDRQVEQRPITQSTMLVKEKADGPNLPRL